MYHIYNAPQAIMSTDLAVNISVTMLNGENVTVTSVDPPMIENATILEADIVTGNGVIHVTDTVFLPESYTHSVVDLAVEDEAFSILTGLLVNYSLVETLQGPGPFTVLAPTNEAFAAIDTEGLTDEDIVSILLYHVTSGIVTADMATDNMALAMLNDAEAVIRIDPDSGVATIAGATILLTDILANNGYVFVEQPLFYFHHLILYLLLRFVVLFSRRIALPLYSVIHVVDSVMLPPDFETGDTAVLAQEAKTDLFN